MPSLLDLVRIGLLPMHSDSITCYNYGNWKPPKSGYDISDIIYIYVNAITPMTDWGDIYPLCSLKLHFQVPSKDPNRTPLDDSALTKLFGSDMAYTNKLRVKMFRKTRTCLSMVRINHCVKSLLWNPFQWLLNYHLVIWHSHGKWDGPFIFIDGFTY